MLFGIRTTLNNELCVEYELSTYVSIENNKIANVRLPESAKPTLLGNNLRILYATFNPKLIYLGNADDTIKGWNYLEAEGILLGRISVVLAIKEIFDILVQRFWHASPIIMYPAEIAYLMYFLKNENVKNLEDVIPKIRRKINGSLISAERELRKGTLPSLAVMPLIETLASIESELWISRELVNGGFDVAFNIHVKGPDLYVEQKGIKLEVTKRGERWSIKEYEAWIEIAKQSPAKASIQLHPTALLITLLLSLADKLEKEMKQGDIVLVDISSLFEGLTLLALKHFSKMPENLDFKEAMKNAFERLSGGEKSIVFYARARDISAATIIDAKTAITYIDIIKKHASPLISLRRKYPYTTVKIFSEIMKYLDEEEMKNKIG